MSQIGVKVAKKGFILPFKVNENPNYEFCLLSGYKHGKIIVQDNGKNQHSVWSINPVTGSIHPYFYHNKSPQLQRKATLGYNTPNKSTKFFTVDDFEIIGDSDVEDRLEVNPDEDILILYQNPVFNINVVLHERSSKQYFKIMDPRSKKVTPFLAKKVRNFNPDYRSC